MIYTLYFFLIFLALLNLETKAMAYLNPGTGSYIFQISVAFFLGGLMLFKQFWAKIRITMQESVRRLLKK